MPRPPGFVKCQNLVQLCRDFPEMARALMRYRCAGHKDSQGYQNHIGLHNQVWGPRRLKLCTRAPVCPFNAWCSKGVLQGNYSLGSRQKRHVKRCVKKRVARRVWVLACEEGGQPNVLPPSPVLTPAAADMPGIMLSSPVLAPAQAAVTFVGACGEPHSPSKLFFPLV